MAADVFLGLPRRIHVGGATYRVMLVPDDHPTLDGADGMTVFGEFRIYLAASMPLQRAINVVVHEVTHCINWAFGVGDESTEEQFTTQHSNGLIEVWIRNPRLLNWIVKQVRAAKREAARD